jgi:hypothetical protein
MNIGSTKDCIFEEKGYNHSSTPNLISEGKTSPDNAIRFHLTATLRVQERFGVTI